MLSCIYLRHSGTTGPISNLQFETKSGSKRRETIYKGNIILDYLKGISRWESWIGVPNRELLGNYWVINRELQKN